jgi:hypothetical protein
MPFGSRMSLLLQRPLPHFQLVRIQRPPTQQLHCTMAKEASDIRNEIRKIQMQRKLAQQRHEVTTSRLKQRCSAAQAKLRTATEFQRRNSRSVYAEALEELMGPCRAPEEARLLEVSHMIEINEHLLEIMVVQFRDLTDYMVCEINVLEEERKEIQKEHAAKYTLLMEGMARFTDSFRSSSKPQKPTRRASFQPSMPKRPSCGTSRRGSVGSGFPCLRRPVPMFQADDFPDDDELSVVSDLSMSAASVYSWNNGKSVGTTDTVSSRGELDSPYSQNIKPSLNIPESERFTVIKL